MSQCSCAGCIERRTGESPSVIEQIAALAASVGVNNFSLNVSDAAVDLIAAMPGAKTQVHVFAPDTREPYAIESARVCMHGVDLIAQRPGRPATEAEVESTRWIESPLLSERAGTVPS